MDLPILAGALENLIRIWYKEEQENQETVLMDKKDFKRRIEPLKELVDTQFEGTEHIDRIKRSIGNMNRMSITEMMTNFFDRIGMVIGDTEKKALRARNLSAHGTYKGYGADFQEIVQNSNVYECIIVKVALKLLGYNGNYRDYGAIGWPEKNIDCPCGDDNKEDVVAK